MTSFGNGACAYAVELGNFCIKSPRYACYFWTDTWGATNKHHPIQCKQTSLWLYLPMGPNTGHNYSATAKCAVFLPLTNYVVVSHKILFATVEFSFFNNYVVLSVYQIVLCKIMRSYYVKFNTQFQADNRPYFEVHTQQGCAVKIPQKSCWWSQIISKQMSYPITCNHISVNDGSPSLIILNAYNEFKMLIVSNRFSVVPYILNYDNP